MERYFIKVYGIVQAVGFRYFVYITADSLNLTGWVRNSMDGTVEIEAQGSSKHIEAFKVKVEEGNRFSKVSNIKCEKIDALSSEKSFKITN